MLLNTYLTFDDNCREVFEFYRSIFGGEFLALMTYGDGPEGMSIPEAELDRIMHVSLPIGSSILMGSDTCTSFGPPPAMGDNFSLSFRADTKEHADDIFAKLSDGGAVKWPMDDAFWGDYFGACTDKFGINWQVLAASEDK